MTELVRLFRVDGTDPQIRLVKRALKHVDDDFEWDLAAARLKRRYGLATIPVTFERIPAQPGLPSVLWGQVRFSPSFNVRFKPDLTTEDPDRVTSNILHELIGHAVTDGCLLSAVLRRAVMGTMPGHPTEWSGQEYGKRPQEGWAETAVALHSDVRPAFRGLYTEDVPARDFTKLRAILSQFGSIYAFPAPPPPPIPAPGTTPPPATAEEPPPPEPAPTPEPPPDPTVPLQARIAELERAKTDLEGRIATGAGAVNDFADFATRLAVAAQDAAAKANQVALDLTEVGQP